MTTVHKMAPTLRRDKSGRFLPRISSKQALRGGRIRKRRRKGRKRRGKRRHGRRRRRRGRKRSILEFLKCKKT